MRQFWFVIAMAAISLAGCSKDNPVGPDVAGQSQSGPSPAPTTPHAAIVKGGASTPGCPNCLVGPSFEFTAQLSGFQGPTSFLWKLYRYDRLIATSTGAGFNPTSHLPGNYSVRLWVADTANHRASATTAFTVRPVWWENVPWDAGYRTLSAPSDYSAALDKAFVLVELIEKGYSYFVHDWAAAEFQDPVSGKRLWLFNRVKRVRFENRMAALIYALTVSGDADWWSGNASAAHHWDLSAGSMDRNTLRKYVLLSVSRIDYPPQSPGDVIHYYQ